MTDKTTPLAKTFARLDALIKQKRGAIGNQRLVDIINDLTSITERLSNGEGKKVVPVLRRHTDKLLEALDGKDGGESLEGNRISVG